MTPKDVGNTVASITTGSVGGFLGYVPQLIGGLVLLLIGVVLSGVVKKAIVKLYEVLNADDFLKKFKLDKKTTKNWVNVLAELARWTVLVLFLIPAMEALGIPGVTVVLNDLLTYIPNVFVSVVIGFVGFIAARMIYDIVYGSLKGLGSKRVVTLSLVAKYAVIFFTALIILEQLGVAAYLVRILFTGMVAMLAIAGGLAFGLGGKGLAKDILEEVRRKIR